MTKGKDYSGKRFGRLTVLEHVGYDKHGRAQWRCLCDCGKETTVASSNLRAGYTRSCGCLFQEMNKGITRDGNKASKLYMIWAGMKDRCLNPNNKKYARYGGRGITICQEWMKFEPFMEWSLSHGYMGGLSIDRIDNDKGYYPENCQWTTVQKQALNRDFSQARSGVRGVSWHKATGKWYARVIYQRKVVYARFFDDLGEATHAVEEQRTIIFNQ